jgi:hypothetical protein
MLTPHHRNTYINFISTKLASGLLFSSLATLIPHLPYREYVNGAHNQFSEINIRAKTFSLFLDWPHSL